MAVVRPNSSLVPSPCPSSSNTATQHHPERCTPEPLHPCTPAGKNSGLDWSPSVVAYSAWAVVRETLPVEHVLGTSGDHHREDLTPWVLLGGRERIHLELRRRPWVRKTGVRPQFRRVHWLVCGRVALTMDAGGVLGLAFASLSLLSLSLYHKDGCFTGWEETGRCNTPESPSNSRVPPSPVRPKNECQSSHPSTMLPFGPTLCVVWWGLVSKDPHDTYGLGWMPAVVLPLLRRSVVQSFNPFDRRRNDLPHLPGSISFAADRISEGEFGVVMGGHEKNRIEAVERWLPSTTYHADSIGHWRQQ